jgi:Domain of unknown function (DUF4190)
MSQPVHYGAPPAAEPPRTDVLAILGLVFAFVVPVVGLVLSILGLRRTRRDGTAGHGLALAGLIISIVLTLFGALAIIGLVALATTAGSTSP